MENKFIYRSYVSGEKHISGFIKNEVPVEFNEEQIKKLKSLPENKQEEYALTILQL